MINRKSSTPAIEIPQKKSPKSPKSPKRAFSAPSFYVGCPGRAPTFCPLTLEEEEFQKLCQQKEDTAKDTKDIFKP